MMILAVLTVLWGNLFLMPWLVFWIFDSAVLVLLVDMLRKGWFNVFYTPLLIVLVFCFFAIPSYGMGLFGCLMACH